MLSEEVGCCLQFPGGGGKGLGIGLIWERQQNEKTKRKKFSTVCLKSNGSDGSTIFYSIFKLIKNHCRKFLSLLNSRIKNKYGVEKVWIVGFFLDTILNQDYL